MESSALTFLFAVSSRVLASIFAVSSRVLVVSVNSIAFITGTSRVQSSIPHIWFLALLLMPI